MMKAGSIVLGALVALLSVASTGHASADSCLTGSTAAVAGDPAAIATARATIAASCPCASFDGSAGRTRAAYQKCATVVVDSLIGSGALRDACRSTVRRLSAVSVCGRKPEADPVACIRKTARGAVSCSIKAPSLRCADRPGIYDETPCSGFTHCIDAADVNGDLLIDDADGGRCSSAATPSPAPAFTPTPGPVPTPTAAPGGPQPYPTGALGTGLAQAINTYRVAHGKPPIPLSPTLMAVAGAHVADLHAHSDMLSSACNLHSWSDGRPVWSGCCYDPNHTQAACMWSKPLELSTALHYARYPGNGYEIAFTGWNVSPQGVVDFFDKSPPHKAVILNEGIWEPYSPFPAMGAAMQGEFAVVWFGSDPDPQH
jgi:hypothetical protein